MRRLTLAALALLLVPAALTADQSLADAAAPVLEPPTTEAPEPWSLQDPADSLYRSAREAMNRGDHRRAARLFHEVWTRHPRSSYAPDSPYWEAFNRYRIGDTGELEQALELLEVQAERYAGAATRKNGDADSLRTRIAGVLARRGDSDAAESIVMMANEMAGMGARIGAEVGARMEVLAEEMAMRGQVMGEQLARIAEEGVAIGMRMNPGSTADVPEHCREQVESQLAALNALIHMSSERAVPVLKRLLERRDECSLPLRRRAMFLVAEKQSPETIDILLTAARTDPDPEVRRQAVFWLSEVDDARAVDALDTFLKQGQDDEIKERAIFALSQHDSPRARQILRRVAQDRATPEPLRMKAIFWLGSEGDDRDLDFLKEMFGRFPEHGLNERILFTVGQAERKGDARWLLSVAADSKVNPELRRTAIFWAAEAGAPPAELGDLYGRIQDRKLKERILFGLSESDEPEAIDRLIRIVRTERDPELRRKAIFWLGNSDDPRAADVLMDVLLEADEGGSR